MSFDFLDRAPLRFIVLGIGVAACSAAGGNHDFSSGGEGGSGVTIAVAGSDASSGSGVSTASGMLDDLQCPSVPQSILALDFRSGWWSGGGGGEFYNVALNAVISTCSNVTIEYHHFETGIRVKCVLSSNGGPGCQQFLEAPPTTAQGISALFEKPSFDDYTQLWILSGSELDSTDVALTGALFDHFITQTSGSCIPVLIGAGDGFITHGNAVASELGLGDVLSTEFVEPGFFSVAMDPNVTVDNRMSAGKELGSHVLFKNVDSMADGVSTSLQSTHGDSISGTGGYQIIAHDTSGRPAIAVGSIQLGDGGDRPFVIDAGFQRFYGMQPGEGTYTFLGNIVKYLGSVGCKSQIQ